MGFVQVENGPLSITFNFAARPRGNNQRKLYDHLYSFLFFVPSRPHYLAEFEYIEIKCSIL